MNIDRSTARSPLPRPGAGPNPGVTMSSTYAISAGWKLLLLDMGLVPERVLRRAGLPVDLFSRDQPRLPSEQYHALWRALEVEAGSELPLRVARAVSVEAFEPALFAAICCPDLVHAASRVAQYRHRSNRRTVPAI